MYLLTPWTRPLLCLTLLCLSAPDSAFAATNPGDQDLIRDRQNRLLEEQQRRLEELKDLPGKEVNPVAPAGPVDTRCFPIQHIELKGADSLSGVERERLLKSYVDSAWAFPSSINYSSALPTITSSKAWSPAAPTCRSKTCPVVVCKSW